MEDLILKYLKEGKTQAEISELLQAAEIKPNSLSIIEKKLKAMRAKYGAKTMFHLAVIIQSKAAERNKIWLISQSCEAMDLYATSKVVQLNSALEALGDNNQPG